MDIESDNSAFSSGITALEGALSAARHGLRIFPVHSPVFSPDGQLIGCSCESPDCSQVGKHSRIKGYPELATTDQDQIGNWAKKWPDSNFGILMDGVFGLDPDPRHGGDLNLKRLESEYGPLPKTFTIRSGSGGLNRIYKVPPDLVVRNSASKIGPGIDIRGPASSGLFVAPGSMHHSGNRYELVNDQDPIEAPDWLLNLIQQVSKARSKELPEIIPKGQRNTVLASLAGAMRNYGLTADEMLPSMEAVSERFEEPMDSSEIEQVAQSIERYPPSKSNGKVPTIRLYNAAELMDMDLPEPRWAIPDMVPEGLNILAGKGKIGKSWMALDFALAIASGSKVFGEIDVDQGEVLYLALEDNQRRMQDRIKKLTGGKDVPLTLSIAHEWPRLDEGGLDEIDRWLDRHSNARLVIVDVLARVKGRGKGNRNAYELDYDLIAPIQSSAKSRGTAIDVLHHLRKGDSDDPMDLVSGSLGQVGPADGVQILRRKRGEKASSLFVMGRDITDERDLAVEFKDARWKILGNAEAIRMSAERRRIVNYVQDSRHPVSPTDVSRQLELNYDATKKMMARMADDGQLAREQLGNRTLYYAPVRIEDAG